MYRRFRRIPPRVREGDENKPVSLPTFALPDGTYLTHGFLHGSGALYKYTGCRPNPSLPNVLWSKAEPPGEAPGLNILDRAELLAFDDSGAVTTTDPVFRSCRANVAIQSGEWYFEVQVLEPNTAGTPDATPHVRLGLSRREFALDAPVGSDAYSYGIADKGRTLHMSRPAEFGAFTAGDVIGFHVALPAHTPTALFRTRVPFEAGGQIWFDYPDYLPKKELQELVNPKFAAEAPVPGEFIQGSWVKVYKNGEYMGTMAENLREFLPPFSTIQDAIGSGANYDDGLLGYYPTISCFNGGMARFNLGPDFSFAKPEGARSCHERWAEHIADDVYMDLVDQVVFEVQDTRHPDLKPMVMEQVPFVLREAKDGEENIEATGEVTDETKEEKIDWFNDDINDMSHDMSVQSVQSAQNAQNMDENPFSTPFKPTLDHIKPDWDFEEPKRMHLED